jgi:hypothetical protein
MKTNKSNPPLYDIYKNFYKNWMAKKLKAGETSLFYNRLRERLKMEEYNNQRPPSAKPRVLPSRQVNSLINNTMKAYTEAKEDYEEKDGTKKIEEYGVRFYHYLVHFIMKVVVGYAKLFSGDFPKDSETIFQFYEYSKILLKALRDRIDKNFDPEQDMDYLTVREAAWPLRGQSLPSARPGLAERGQSEAIIDKLREKKIIQ